MNQIKTFIRFIQALPNPKPQQPTIESYGQASSGISADKIQSVMEWLFLSLFNAGYFGTAHIIWYNDREDSNLQQSVKDGIRCNELTFLYRCGSKVQPLPDGYYWRLMTEFTNMRMYQLEIKND